MIIANKIRYGLYSFMVMFVLSGFADLCSIEGICEICIVNRKSALARELIINKAMRYSIQGAGALALISLLKYTYSGNVLSGLTQKAGTVTTAATTVPTQEELEKRVHALELFKEKVIKHLGFLKEEDPKEAVGAVQWCKNSAKTIWDKGKDMFAVQVLIASSYTVGNAFTRIFHSGDIHWFLATHTRLGSFVNKNKWQGHTNETFEAGSLLANLKFSAVRYDASCAVADKDYFKKTLVAVCADIVRDIEAVVAFIEYKVDGVSKQEQVDGDARYLFNLTNDFVDTVEKAMDTGTVVSPVVVKFIADLEHVISNFACFERCMKRS